MKSLGFENSWGGYYSYPNGWDGPKVYIEGTPPEEYTKCRELGHKLECISNHQRCLTTYTCPICQITWQVDSSG